MTANDTKPSFVLPTEPAEVGMSTTLLFALPMLSVLVQCIAEADDCWNYLNLTAASGAWVGVARRGLETELIVSTNSGEPAAEPYRGDVHDTLVAHGFEHVPEHVSYDQMVAFPEDDAFLALARLIVGTFQHAYHTDLRESMTVELRLGAP